MQRKKFIRTISSAAFIAAASTEISFSRNIFSSNEVIKPLRLRKGSRTGIAAPGSFITREELQQSIENLKALGLNPVYSERILLKTGYFAGEDEQRAADLNEMFEDKSIEAIVCARGGYGCTRILPLLDYELIRKNPKIFIGYSDITSLLFGIFKNTGMICFHGPVGISTFNEFTVNNLRNVITNPHEEFILYNAEPEKDQELYRVNVISSGKAKGKLIGGNLSVAVSLVGTPYDIDYENKIVFFEEVGEEPYRIDRMLTQLLQSGKLQKAAGIALGVFDGCMPEPEESGIANSFSLREVLSNRLIGLNIPVIYGMSFGHIRNKFTLPFGIEAEINTFDHTITLLEQACI